MSVYAIVLFLHVLGAVGFFVGLVLEGFVHARLRGAETLDELRFFARAADRLKAVYIPSFAGVLLGGLYLASIVGSAQTLWLAASLAALVAIMIIGGAITGVRVARLGKTLAASSVDLAAAREQAAAKALRISYGLRGGIALGILFLMTTKPDLATSIAALVVAAAIGLALSLRPRRGGPACGFQMPRIAGGGTPS